MVALMIQLAQATLTNWLAWMIFLLAFVAAIRWKINAAWLVLGGALVGWLLAHWVVQN